jgi:hypothetical protein
VCRGVWPQRDGKREGGRWVVVGVRTHNRGESFTVARQRRWLIDSDTAYGARGKVGGGGDMRVWICRINLGMVGLRYVRTK